MDTEAFLKAYNEPRNGTDGYHRNWGNRRFIYTDGVRECADAGLHWFLDILATEAIPFMADHPESTFMVVKLRVNRASSAVIVGEMFDDDPSPWRTYVGFTDAPEGEWTFFIQNDGEHFVMLLPSEY